MKALFGYRIQVDPRGWYALTEDPIIEAFGKDHHPSMHWACWGEAICSPSAAIDGHYHYYALTEGGMLWLQLNTPAQAEILPEDMLEIEFTHAKPLDR